MSNKSNKNYPYNKSNSSKKGETKTNKASNIQGDAQFLKSARNIALALVLGLGIGIGGTLVLTQDDSKETTDKNNVEKVVTDKENTNDNTTNNNDSNTISLDLSETDLDYDYKSGIDIKPFTEKITLEEMQKEFAKYIGNDLKLNLKESNIGDNSSFFEEELKDKESVLLAFDYKGDINEDDAKKIIDIANAITSPYGNLVLTYNQEDAKDGKFAMSLLFVGGKYTNSGGETAKPDPTELFTLVNKITAHLEPATQEESDKE